MCEVQSLCEICCLCDVTLADLTITWSDVDCEKVGYSLTTIYKSFKTNFKFKKYYLKGQR